VRRISRIAQHTSFLAELICSYMFHASGLTLLRVKLRKGKRFMNHVRADYPNHSALHGLCRSGVGIVLARAAKCRSAFTTAGMRCSSAAHHDTPAFRQRADAMATPKEGEMQVGWSEVYVNWCAQIRLCVQQGIGAFVQQPDGQLSIRPEGGWDGRDDAHVVVHRGVLHKSVRCFLLRRGRLYRVTPDGFVRRIRFSEIGVPLVRFIMKHLGDPSQIAWHAPGETTVFSRSKREHIRNGHCVFSQWRGGISEASFRFHQWQDLPASHDRQPGPEAQDRGGTISVYPQELTHVWVEGEIAVESHGEYMPTYHACGNPDPEAAFEADVAARLAAKLVAFGRRQQWDFCHPPEDDADEDEVGADEGAAEES
jgi:hypothetical protein